MHKKLLSFLALCALPLSGYCDLLHSTSSKDIWLLLFGLTLIILFWAFAFISMFDALAVVRRRKAFQKHKTLIRFGLPAILSGIALFGNPLINLIVNLQIIPITLTIVAGLLYTLYWYRTAFSPDQP